jgi:hypothetical protein
MTAQLLLKSVFEDMLIEYVLQLLPSLAHPNRPVYRILRKMFTFAESLALRFHLRPVWTLRRMSRRVTQTVEGVCRRRHGKFCFLLPAD